MSHRCPANGCTRTVSPAMLMCRPHWYMVPKPLRDAVWNAWGGGAGAGTAPHQAAILAAVEAVDRTLAQRSGGSTR